MEQPISYPVNTVDDAYDACHPETPLHVNDSRYVDLTEARGGENFSQRMAFRVRHTKAPNFHQQLISGHRGCGKSTELLQLQTKLEEAGFFTVYIDVEDMLDLADIQYFDLLFSMARGIADHADQAKLKINESLLTELANWFAEYTVTEEHRADVETAIKNEAGGEIKLFNLVKILANITAHFKNASSQRATMRLEVTKDITRFIERLNTFINDIRRAAKEKGKHDLVVIIDGLEKMQYRQLDSGESNYKALYLNHKEQLKAPQCHLFYTVPITLAFDENIRDAFPEAPFILPMVNQKSDPGRTALHDIIAKRLVIAEVFENPAYVSRIAAMSGGSVRDLLRLVRLACEDASDKITEKAVDNAIKRMAKEFDRALRDVDLEPLKHVSETKALANTEAERRLLNLRFVHEYENGQRWADLHPVLREVSRVKKALESTFN